MEHIKCRLQVQHGKGAADAVYNGPVQAMQSIIRQHGFSRLYQGWWASLYREIPAFALYFASYDMIKNHVNEFVFEKSLPDSKTMLFGESTVEPSSPPEPEPQVPARSMQTKAWLSSAIAGGFAGAITWAVVYPVDVIKTRIQTAPLTTPRSDLTMWKVGGNIVRKQGWRCLFRGLGITLVRAFPVNATLFPIYEFTLLQLQVPSSPPTFTATTSTTTTTNTSSTGNLQYNC